MLLGLVVVAACGPPRPERSGDPLLEADVRVSPTPAVLRGSRVTIVALDEGAPLVGASVRLRVEPDASATTRAVEPDASTDTEGGEAGWIDAPAAADQSGIYGPVEVGFAAPGDWWVIVELRSADQRVASLRTPLSVVGAAASEVGR